ncbi:uncharacterized protein LOC123988657 [Osmia bicornis bicornis]|uniref:uncharacterized protein LOC123988657 n=1 Tax=Osmia bicornis bicornis TaxID=1437191 RepID=UPI001EAF7CFA|nr:uncharacterized protein LOC123988657 [Osmia bicornis bicornis]
MVNPIKTEMVLFSRKRGFEFKALSLFGVEISLSISAKYLGVTLDMKLNWKLHIGKQAQKAIATYWACRRMFGTTWGLKPRMVRWIYTAILVPQVTYASVVWWNVVWCMVSSMKKQCNRRHLEKIHRLALLGMTGTFRTTPTMAMGALMDLAPPHIMVEAGAKSTAVKLFLAGKWKMASTGHASILREFREPVGALTLGGDACDPTYHFKNSFRVNIPFKEAWDVNREELLTPGGLIWYTDGSKTKTGTGAGIWGARPRAEIAMSLDPHVSILQAEVFAIWACAKLCLERNYRDKHIYICSDSKAALGSIRATIMRSMLVQDCTDMLERLANNNNRVNLIWVPGYAGIPGNEKANMLAREGARRPSPDTAYRIGVDRGTAKETVREWACTQTHLTGAALRE